MIVPRNRVELLKYALQAAFILITLIFVVLYLSSQLDRIRSHVWQANIGLLILAQLFFAAGYAIFPLAPYLILKYLGQPLPKDKVWRTYYASTLMKYLPGSVWSLPGRVFLYQRAGIPSQKGTSSLFWELMLMVGSGMFVSLLCARLMIHYLPVPVVLFGSLIFIVGFPALLFGLRSERLYQSASRIRLLRPVVEIVAAPSNRLTQSQMFTIIGVFLISWLILGIGFTLLIDAFEPGVTLIHSLEFTGLFAGAWVAGFVVIFSPGGIGIREGLLGLGLAVVLNDPLPILIAIVSRILWTIAEIMGLSTIWLYQSYKRRTNMNAINVN